MTKFQALLLLSIIVAAGAFLRFWGTIHGSFAFTYDVGRDLLAVQKMVEIKRFSLLGPTMGVEGLFYGPWWYWFLAVPFILSGGNPFFVTASIGIFGTAMILIAYFFGREIGGNFWGLPFALAVAFSSPLVNFSTQIWSPDLLPPLMLSSITLYYFLIKGKLKNFFCWLFLGLFTGLTFEMEASFGFFFILAMFFALGWKTIKDRKWLSFNLFLFGIFLVELPRIIFETRHNFLQTKALFQVFQMGSSTGGDISFLKKLSENLSLFWLNWSETLGAQNTWFSIFALIVVLIILLFYGRNIKKAEMSLLKILLLILGLTLLGFSLYSRSLWLHYFVGLPLAYLLIFVLAARIFWEKSRLGKKVVALVFVIFIFINARPIGIYKSIKEPLFKGDAAVFRNQIKVLDALYQGAHGEKFNYVAYTPPLYTYTWDYLFSWYGEKKYGYGPDKETEKIFYLIIEPEFEHPERLENWFKIRENDGKFVKKEIIAGGIILEKRTR